MMSRKASLLFSFLLNITVRAVLLCVALSKWRSAKIFENVNNIVCNVAVIGFKASLDHDGEGKGPS